MNKSSIPVICLSFLISSNCVDNNKGNDLPNIIIIVADDLGYNDLGCYGQTLIKTPFIDMMASEGVRFTNHYSGSSVCAPSRGSLMTGMHTGNAYIKGNFAMEKEGNLPLPVNSITIPKLLNEAGYSTAIIGKWGLGGPNDHGHPNHQGFDYSFCYLDQRLAHEYYPTHLWRNSEKVVLDNQDGKKNDYSHDLFTDEALTFISNHKNEPFFLYLPYTIPHGKYEVPDQSTYSEKSWSERDINYASMISRMDRDVGRILSLLDQLDLAKKTIVFFTSDNGPTRGPGSFFQSNKPFRGYKLELYEGGIRVPLIIRWPGKIQANTVSDHISAFWDYMPTICELAGITIPEETDGISFMSAMQGRDNQQHEYLYWEFFDYNYNWQSGSSLTRNQITSQAMRVQNMKTIVHYSKSGVPTSLELYNLASDPGEEVNLASDNPDLVKSSFNQMQRIRKDSEFFTAIIQRQDL